MWYRSVTRSRLEMQQPTVLRGTLTSELQVCFADKLGRYRPETTSCDFLLFTLENISIYNK